MANRLVSLLDLYLTLETLRYSDQQHDEINDYYDALLTPIELTKVAPDVFSGVVASSTARARIANATGKGTSGYGFGSTVEGAESGAGVDPPGGAAQHPVLAHFQAVEEIRGKPARVRIRDLDTSTDIFTLYGTVQDLSMTVAEARLTISSTDSEAMQELLPKVRVLDIYPNADFRNTNETDTPVVVVFGAMKKVTLSLCQSAANQYDYGAFRKPATGSLVVNAVYRNGRVVPSALYSLVESPVGLYVIRFTTPQTDTNGTAFDIKADVTATEFIWSADAVKFLLSDATYGLARTVNAASFAAAVTDYGTLNMVIVDGLRTREPAGDLLAQLLLHGATLDKNVSNEYTITVDMAALHSSATMKLGADDRQWNNVLLDSVEVPLPSLDSQVKQLVINGLFDPGFQGSGTYLMKATRADATRRGIVKEVQNRFLGDVTSLDRQTDYQYKRLKYRDKAVTGDAHLEASALNLNQLVSFSCPDLAIDETYEITEIGFRGSKAIDGNITATVPFALGGYHSLIFTYEPGAVAGAPNATYQTDYSLTPPDAVTGFALNGSAIILTAGDGKKKTLQPVKANAPSVNVSHLWFRAVPAGAVEAPYTQIKVTPGQANVPCTLEMQPGIVYVLECYAFNGANNIDAQLSLVSQITSHTAAGDTTLPADVTGVSATAGTGKAINVAWTRVVDTSLKEYIIYRGTSADPTAEYARSLTNSFTDVNVAYGTSYFYRIKAVDNSGNVSNAYSSNGSATVAKITGGSGDIGTGTITGGNVGSGTLTGTNIATATINDAHINTLSAGKITTGTLTVASSNGASEILIKGGASAAHLRIQANDATPAEIRFENTSASIKSRISGTSGGALKIIPETDGVGGLAIGDTGPNKRWGSIVMTALSSSIVSDLLLSNEAQLNSDAHVKFFSPAVTADGDNTGDFWIKDFDNFRMSGNSIINQTASGGLAAWVIRLTDSTGTILGYIPVYTSKV